MMQPVKVTLADGPLKVTRAELRDSPRRHRNACGICCALFLEAVAWALAVIALCTSWWLAPRHGQLHGLAHAGLWIACHKPVTGDVLFSSATINGSEPIGNAFTASIAAISTDLHATANPGAEAGCTNSIALYGAFGSAEDATPHNFSAHAKVLRTLAVAFLGFGLVKALGGTLCATAYGRLRRCVGSIAAVSASAQLLCGWAVCGLFVYVVAAGRLGVDDLGWSWWLYLAALVNATLSNASFCCV